MSDLVIKDGTGTGNRAKVDSNNRIQVKSTISTDLEFASRIDEKAFSFSALEMQITSSGGEHHFLWLKNIDPNNIFHINGLFVSYNGGNTNHNRVVTGRVRFGSSTPSANATSFNGVNINLTSSNLPLVESYRWDGVGDGMTVAVNGLKGLSSYFPQGLTTIDFNGAFIIGYNQILDFSVQAEEDGYVSVGLSGWFENI